MPTENTNATSAATNADANGVQNLSIDQGAQKLFENIAKHQAAEEKKAAEQVRQSPPEESGKGSETSDDTASDSTESTAEVEASDETTAAPEGEGEADSEAPAEETDLSHRTLDEKTKERIQKRIDKEVAKRKTLETRLAGLEAALQEKEAQVAQKPVPVVDVSNQPLPHITDMGKLNDLKRSAKEAIRWAEEQLDSEAITNGETITAWGQTYDKHALKAVMRQARVTLEDHVPQREQFLNTQAQARQAAIKEFPFLSDKSTPEYQMAQAARTANPWLASLPNADWIIAMQVKGYKAYEAEKSAAKAKATAPAKPKTITAKPSGDQTATTTSGGSPARVAPQATSNRQAIQSAKATFDAKGGVSAGEAAEYLQLMQRSRNSR